MPWEERPIWYDIYKVFPPKRDPTYRSIVATSSEDHPPLPRKIFYEEDKIRALVIISVLIFSKLSFYHSLLIASFFKSYYFKELGPIEHQVLNGNLRKTIWDL